MKCSEIRAVFVCHRNALFETIYTHYISTSIGFSVEVDQQLLRSLDLTVEHNRYVTLVMDEVHIKEDLVYDKHHRIFV